jgi:hypothetical protein
MPERNMLRLLVVDDMGEPSVQNSPNNHIRPKDDVGIDSPMQGSISDSNETD